MDDTPLTDPPAFGLAAHALDDRLRLFGWVTGPDRLLYLWILRAFDRARQAYEVRLTTTQLASALEEFAADDPAVPDPSDLAASLDALVDWGVLDRTHDSGRVTSIADYRRRASVYQLTELGYLAHAAVERVVSARPDDAQLKAVALGSILEDLEALAEANRARDAWTGWTPPRRCGGASIGSPSTAAAAPTCAWSSPRSAARAPRWR